MHPGCVASSEEKSTFTYKISPCGRNDMQGRDCLPKGVPWRYDIRGGEPHGRYARNAQGY
jgi:hypothetical protein